MHTQRGRTGPSSSGSPGTRRAGARAASRLRSGFVRADLQQRVGDLPVGIPDRAFEQGPGSTLTPLGQSTLSTGAPKPSRFDSRLARTVSEALVKSTSVPPPQPAKRSARVAMTPRAMIVRRWDTFPALFRFGTRGCPADEILRVRGTQDRRAGGHPRHQIWLLHDARGGARGGRGDRRPCRHQVPGADRRPDEGGRGAEFADTPDEAAEHAEAILKLEIAGHMPRGVLVDPKAEVDKKGVLQSSSGTAPRSAR